MASGGVGWMTLSTGSISSAPSRLWSYAAGVADQMGENPYDRVDDLERAARPGDPPAPGAQWDELHQRWERWDEATASWVVLGDDPAPHVPPEEENPLPAQLARELVRADDLEPDERYEDVPRVAEPSGEPPMPGAQWNEVEARWERWDEDRQAWVEITDGGPEAAAGPTDAAG